MKLIRPFQNADRVPHKALGTVTKGDFDCSSVDSASVYCNAHTWSTGENGFQQSIIPGLQQLVDETEKGDYPL